MTTLCVCPQVPAFAVTDDTGKPYVAEFNGQNKGFFFLDPEAAEQFASRVKELQQGKPVGTTLLSWLVALHAS